VTEAELLPAQHDTDAAPCAPIRGKHDKDARQQALMAAATAVFAERGYDAATTRAVAERAGCSEGLIHRYFGGKRGLLVAVLQAKARSFHARMAAEVPDRDDLREEIHALLRWALRAMWEQRDFLCVTISRSAIDREVGRAIGAEINAARVEIIAAKLERHKGAGRVREDVDTHALAHAITGINLATGFFQQVVFGADAAELARITDTVADALWRGIATETQRTGDPR
jgi:AcrR family transcriptional regulator